MAYSPNRIKSMSAGSGRAPSLFTYRTPDLVAEVTTEGYFDEALFFEPNDIIYANTNDNATMAFLICVKNDKLAPIGTRTDFSVTSTFLGDVRATDVAGYRSENFSGGIGAGAEVPGLYTYRNNTDAKAAIIAADYFLEAGTFLKPDDLIHSVSVDAAVLLRVLTATISGVTVEEVIFV